MINIFSHPFEDLDFELEKLRERSNSEIYLKRSFRLDLKIELRNNDN